MKISVTYSGNSLKEDLSIDTTFDPCYFSWDSPFKGLAELSLKVGTYLTVPTHTLGPGWFVELFILHYLLNANSF